MKRNGFTLIELLATIVILGIAGSIVIVSSRSILKNQKDKLYKQQTDNILKKAEEWSLKNTNKLDDNIYLSLDTLIKDGYIDGNDIINPKTNNKLVGCVNITHNSEYNQYEFFFVDDTICDGAI